MSRSPAVSQGVILPQLPVQNNSAALVLDMFTLCMSRGHPPLPETSQAYHQNTNLSNKQVKGGYLLRYRRGFFCKGWCEEYVVLYEDSTLAWFSDKSLSRPRGFVQLSEAPELLAVGEYTRQVPKKPRFPKSCNIGQVLAIGSRTMHNTHWLMGQSPGEISDWMTAISNTLPPPPHLPLDNHESATKQKNKTNKNTTTNCCSTASQQNGICNNQNYSNDHTVLSGVVINWGHGWGWGQAECAAQMACSAVHETAINSALYCHVEDYALGGCDEVDWSAFGDFSF